MEKILYIMTYAIVPIVLLIVTDDPAPAALYLGGLFAGSKLCEVLKDDRGNSSS